eukprot:SAG31_NODE_6055_length_2190_cov_1.811095_4_plen_75_part_00
MDIDADRGCTLSFTVLVAPAASTFATTAPGPPDAIDPRNQGLTLRPLPEPIQFSYVATLLRLNGTRPIIILAFI